MRHKKISEVTIIMSSEQIYITAQPERRTQLAAAGIILLAAIGLAIIFGLGSGNSDAAAEASQTQVSELPPLGSAGPVEVGDLAYDFTLLDPAGNTVHLGEHLGQPIIVNYWATWCAPCRIEMPEFQAAFAAHQDEGLVILALNQRETSEQVTSYFNELGLTFTPVLDSNGDVATAYGAFNLPTTVFINRQGVVTNIHRGLLLPEQIDPLLAEILSS
jgi:peroxiredoxin